MSIPFVHRPHPKGRSVKIKIERNGQVVVVTPPRYSLSQATAFVLQQETWILKTLAKVQRLSAHSVQSATNIQIFGQNYTIALQPATDQIGIKIEKNSLLVHPISANPTAAATRQQITRFLKSTAEKYIQPRTYQWATVMGITFSRISLRQQKTRWGSCSSQGTLSFNWRLVHHPPAVIDYVIIHELAHRRHMNHSRQFWQLVQQHDPAHLTHRKWLKKYQSSEE